MALKLLTHVLPLLIFPFLSFKAIQFIFGLSFYQNGLQFKLNAICDPTTALASHPFRLAYTVTPEVDKFLCIMVAFFHILMDPFYRPLVAELFTTLAAVAIIMFAEAARDKRPFVLRTPTAVCLIFQFASFGVIMPLYSLLFVITGTASLRPGPLTTPGTKINQANAEALLFSFVLGYIVPTLCMLVYEDSMVTAIWQIFPLFIELSQFAYRVICPPSKRIESGHRTVMATFALVFVASAAVHVMYMWPLLGDWEALRVMVVPSLGALDPAATSLTEGVVEFIKWDFITAAGPTMLSTLWMASNFVQCLTVVLWYGIATVLLGPGTAIAGVLLWREERLNGGNQAEKVEEKTR
ncbi:hypothetical protein BDN67DRAFT_430936 [Paxillus ammoniavirescens]|nr:hypothetical protein BDN67DRAFT_430936 [Paxillus ammoniavirescens]